MINKFFYWLLILSWIIFLIILFYTWRSFDYVGLKYFADFFSDLAPSTKLFIKDFQTLVAGLLALGAALITIWYQGHVNRQEQSNLKKIFEIELYKLYGIVEGIASSTKDISEHQTLENIQQFLLSCGGVPELPRIMWDNILISKLTPKDVRRLVNIRDNYIKLKSILDEVVISPHNFIKFHIHPFIMIFVHQYEEFAENIRISENIDGTKTKYLHT